MRSVAIGWLLSLALAACSDEREGPTGALEAALVHARPLKGSAAPSGPFAGALPHHMDIAAEIRIEAPAGAERLEIKRSIDRGNGFRIDDRRSWTSPSVFPDAPPRVATDRTTAVFDGKVFAHRRGDGDWIERDVLDGHPQRLLVDAYDLDGLVLGGFADYLRWVELAPDEARPASVAGLPVRWSAPVLDPAVQPRKMSEGELAALRDHTANWEAWLAATHRPMRVDGAIARTAAGELAMGRIELAGVATVDGVEAPFVMRLEVAVQPITDAQALVVPADRLPEKRPRTWKMIEAVLGPELAERYRPH